MIPFPAGVLFFMRSGFVSFLEDTIWTEKKHVYKAQTAITGNVTASTPLELIILKTQIKLMMINDILWSVKRANLSQGTFQLSQEVSILQTAVVAVYVVYFKPQLLHHLKVVVNDKSLGKLGIKAVLDFLCPANLTQTHISESRTFWT